MARKKSDKISDYLKELIADFARKQANSAFNYKQVAHAIGALPQQQRTVAITLAEMAFDGDLIEVAPGKYKYPNRGNIGIGTFIRRSNGKNSVLLDDDDEAIFVAERNSMHALNGDRA